LGDFDIEKVKNELLTMIKLSTNGFDLIPDDEITKKSTIEFRKYDSEWISDILIIIQPLTGYTINQIIYEIPLTQIGFLMASYAKK
jgi:hypothetical protein